MPTSDLFLNAKELIDLTGKQRSPSQIFALRKMGVEHKKRPDGKVLVLRKHLDLLMGYKNTASSKRIGSESSINWEALNA